MTAADTIPLTNVVEFVRLPPEERYDRSIFVGRKYFVAIFSVNIFFVIIQPTQSHIRKRVKGTQLC